MSKEYVEQALQTLSNQWHGNKIGVFLFEQTLRQAIEALQNLDAIKKAMFYGKDLPVQLQYKGTTCDHFNVLLDEPTIHGIIGVATEAGEMLEALENSLIAGNTFDSVNLREEMGDVFWYMAVLAKFNHGDFAEIQNTNIAKLRKRYPAKFTSYDAINRDLVGERKILEGETYVERDIEFPKFNIDIPKTVEHASMIEIIANGEQIENFRESCKEAQHYTDFLFKIDGVEIELQFEEIKQIALDRNKVQHQTGFSTKLHQTTDASIWAKEFVTMLNANKPEIDEGVVIGWFANAIETAKIITRKELIEEQNRAYKA